MSRIRNLGYIPERAEAVGRAPRPASYDIDAVPAPVGVALARARMRNSLTLIDFYAAWCTPCAVLETTVLANAGVRKALGDYEFVKVDTDNDVDCSNYFGVVGLPTLVVLDRRGVELYRVEGRVAADELARVLTRLAAEHGR